MTDSQLAQQAMNYRLWRLGFGFGPHSLLGYATDAILRKELRL